MCLTDCSYEKLLKGTFVMSLVSVLNLFKSVYLIIVLFVWEGNGLKDLFLINGKNRRSHCCFPLTDCADYNQPLVFTEKKFIFS